MNEVLYIFFVVLADILAAKWIIELPLGLMVPAGVFAIAPIFTIRDHIHRERGRKASYILIAVASIISLAIAYITANGKLGLVTFASLLAFLSSESVDTEIYHRLMQKNDTLAIIVSNAFSSAIDSFIFISIAFGIDWHFIIGQYLVKMVLSVGYALIKKWVAR